MSIHPEFVDQIFSGKKKYEYRKTLAKQSPDIIIIYETNPTSKIVGEVEVLGFIEKSPEEVWKETNKHSGIDYLRFKKYFENKETAVAYILGKVTIYSQKLSLSDFGIEYAPQSYVYL